MKADSFFLSNAAWIMEIAYWVAEKMVIMWSNLVFVHSNGKATV